MQRCRERHVVASVQEKQDASNKDGGEQDGSTSEDFVIRRVALGLPSILTRTSYYTVV